MSSTVQPIILVSTGRTGTQFFANLLGSLFSQAEVYHDDTRHSSLMNVLTNIHLDGLLPKSVLIEIWKLLKGHELENCQKEFYVDSNNHLYGLVVFAPWLYPGLKVVHIVRDPRTYVRSHINWARHRPRSFFANFILPFWQPNPLLLREMSFREWLSLSQFERFCWIWAFKNRYIATLAHSDVPYLTVRFEDFFKGPDPESHLNRMFRFMGLPEVTGMADQFMQPLNVTHKRTFPKWQDWHPEWCARLHELCGGLMNRYGYGQEFEWLEMVRIGQMKRSGVAA